MFGHSDCDGSENDEICHVQAERRQEREPFQEHVAGVVLLVAVRRTGEPDVLQVLQEVERSHAGNTHLLRGGKHKFSFGNRQSSRQV
jgi:hypothetical protein